MKIIDDGHEDSIISIACLNGRNSGFLSTDQSGHTVYYDSNGIKKYSFKGCRSPRTTVCQNFKFFSMLSANRKKIMIYNIEDNEEIDILKENCQIVNYDILWDKQILLTLVNIHEPEIHLWDIKSKKMINKYFGFNQKRFELDLHFIDKFEGSIFALGDEKGNLIIWHKNQVTPLKVLNQGHTQQINSFSQLDFGDQIFIFTGSDDKSIVIWTNVQDSKVKLDQNFTEKSSSEIELEEQKEEGMALE